MASPIKAKWYDPFLQQTPLQIDDHAAVVQRIGQRPDQRDGDRPIGRKRADLIVIAYGPKHSVALAIAVEDAPQSFVVVQERVGFIN